MKLCTLCNKVEVNVTQSWCAQCRKNYLKEYKKTHASHIRDLMKKWRSKNREYYRESKYEYYSSIPGRLSELNARAKIRAKKKNIKYDLSTEILSNLWEQQGGLCALTKLPMQIPIERHGKASPFSPSIDRIDSSLGYVKDNIRLVTFIANCSLHDYGEEIFQTIAKAYINNDISNIQYLSKTLTNKTYKQAKDNKYFESLKGIISTLYGSCNRSKRNINVTKQDIAKLFELQYNRCALTNIEFDYKFTGNKKSNPFRPSVDRIDCSKGYTTDNIRLVCVAVNYALNEFGDEIFKQICKAYLLHLKNKA